MSQVQLFDIEGAHPQIPTSFVTDSGTAIPVLNILEILGLNGITTTGSGNTVNVVGINATAAANVGLAQIGVAAFNSDQFTVVNGFVSLSGAGLAIDSINVDASTPPGTNPVVPAASGSVTINGSVVANAGIPVQSNSTAANQLAIEVQYASFSPASDATRVGLAVFDSDHFTVDAVGFVSLIGGGQAIDSIGVQTGTNPVVPDVSGLLTINGAVVAAGTNPVRTDGTGANTMAVEVQISQALAATDATRIGLCNFDSAAFDVDANGFVQLNGGGIAATSFDVQANTPPGTDPVVPTAAGQVTVNGAAVANHSVVLETRSRAANAYNIEVQYATTSASTDATKSGVAHFDSRSFVVDANGFVQALGGQTWTDISGVTGTTVNFHYFVTAASTLTLPAAPAQGDVVDFIVDTTGSVVITANGGQTIRLSANTSSVAGTFTNSLRGDAMSLVYRSTGSVWIAHNFVGAWVPA